MPRGARRYGQRTLAVGDRVVYRDPANGGLWGTVERRINDAVVRVRWTDARVTAVYAADLRRAT
jgi:ribosomal protein L35AE/L33A